jgi:hypothetical protein
MSAKADSLTPLSYKSWEPATRFYAGATAAKHFFRDANTGAGQGITDLAAAVQLRLRVALARLALGQARNSGARRIGSRIRVGEHPKDLPREENMAGVGKVQAIHRCVWRAHYVGYETFWNQGHAVFLSTQWHK